MSLELISHKFQTSELRKSNKNFQCKFLTFNFAVPCSVSNGRYGRVVQLTLSSVNWMATINVGGRKTGKSIMASQQQSVHLSLSSRSIGTNFGSQYFCLHNVSLNCPSKGIIRPSMRTMWPVDNNNSYVAFYADSEGDNDGSSRYSAHTRMNFTEVIENDQCSGPMSN